MVQTQQAQTPQAQTPTQTQPTAAEAVQTPIEQPAIIAAPDNSLGVFSYHVFEEKTTPKLGLIYGDYGTGKTIQMMLAANDALFVFTNRSIMLPYVKLWRDLEKIRPGLPESIGLRSPFKTPKDGGLAVILLEREMAGAHQYCFYAWFQQIWWPYFLNLCGPGGVFEKVDTVVFDEASTILQWCEQSMHTTFEKDPRGLGRPFMSLEKGTKNVYAIFEAAFQVHCNSFVQLPTVAKKTTLLVCHEQAPQLYKDNISQKYKGGPLMPVGSTRGIDHYVKDCVFAFRFIAFDRAGAEKAQERMERMQLAMAAETQPTTNSASTLGGSLLSSLSSKEEAPTQLKVSTVGGVRSRKAVVDIPTGRAWLDDVGWQSNLLRIMRTEPEDEWVAKHRIPGVAPIMPADLHKVFVMAEMAKPRKALPDILTTAEMTRLHALGRGEAV